MSGSCARIIWDSNPMLHYAYADFQCFEENYLTATGDSASTYSAWIRGHVDDAEKLCNFARQRLLKSSYPLSQKSAQAPVATRHGDRLTLWLYGPIAAITKPMIEAILANKDASGIVLRVDCPGGLSDGAFLLSSALSKHKAKKLAIVDRSCWSAAVPVTLACNRILIRSNATLMVHPARTSCTGNARDMRQAGKCLSDADEINLRLILRYRRRKIDGRFLRQILSRESFLSAHQSVRYGFADRVIHALPPVAFAAPIPVGDAIFHLSEE